MDSMDRAEEESYESRLTGTKDSVREIRKY